MTEGLVRSHYGYESQTRSGHVQEWSQTASTHFSSQWVDKVSDDREKSLDRSAFTDKVTMYNM